MGEMLKKLLVLFLSINFSLSASPPGGDRKPSISQERLDSLNRYWRGIYWNDTVTTCTAEQIDALNNTMFGAMDLMSHSIMRDSAYQTPGWNRFFMSDDNVPLGTGWGTKYYSQYENIINAMFQAKEFPREGNTKKRKGKDGYLQNWERMTPEHRITLTCNPIGHRGKNECADRNVGAATWSHGHPPDGYNNIIFFCPRFFEENPLLPMETHEPQQPETALPTLVTREYILVHELFHCTWTIHYGFSIDDLLREIPTFGKQKVYGAKQCAAFAWQFTFGSEPKLRSVNAEVRDNADNYAWFFTYNWFHTKFNWKSDGAYVFGLTKREDTSTNSDPTEHQLIDRALGLDSRDNILSEELKAANNTPGYPQANCQPVGNNPMDLKCAYLGGQTYEEWAQEQNQEQAPETTTTGGVPPDPTPTAQMIFVYEWLDTPAKDQSWQITDIPVGEQLDWCGGNNLQYMVAAQSINGTEVPNPIPFPSDMDFSKIDYGGQQPGYKQCTYRGNPDAPGTFDCPNFNAPVQCGKTPKVRELITCPAPTNFVKSWAVSMAICQWGKSNMKQ